MNLYKLIRPALFALDPEVAHACVMNAGVLGRNAPMRACLRAAFDLSDPRLEIQLSGLRFPNPIGLAAGIDKNARAIELLTAFGPGALEIGVVSAHAQPGNPKPRVYRFPNDLALINRMGNPNIGADKAYENLRRTRSLGFDLPPIGLNIGKTTAAPLDKALEDCRYTMLKLYELVDYLILNVSCPNVAEYSKLQERERLQELLGGLQAVNKLGRPIFVKLSADLTTEQIDEALDCCVKNNMSGIIASNTTLSRQGLSSPAPDTGGMSGRPLYPLALGAVRYVAQRLKGKLPIIGVGGVFGAEHVIEMMQAGASMVELYTGLVYEGPGLIKRIKRDLLRRIEQDGVKHISEYVGRQ